MSDLNKLKQRLDIIIGLLSGTDSCIETRGPLNNKGYGIIHTQDGPEQYRDLAHRAVYMLYYNVQLSGDQVVMHTCDNPKCININHLRVGTRADNNADKTAKGRQKNRSKLTQEEVDMIRDLYVNSNLTYLQLAEQFGVEKLQIYRIIKNKSWKNVNNQSSI